MSDEAKKSMQEWARSLIAPVLVAVAVGMGTAYLTAQEAVAVHEERLLTHAAYIDRHAEDLNSLDEDGRDTREALIRVEGQLQRIEHSLEGCQ